MNTPCQPHQPGARSRQMQIHILGSGTCVPSLLRHPCSALVSLGQTRILVDAGTGTMGQLLRLGIHINDIDAILLSHFHLDHCAEVAPFIFSTKYPGFVRTKSLALAAGQGLSRWFGLLNQAHGHTLDMPDEFFRLLELERAGGFEMGGLAIDYDAMAHKPESRAFRFTDPAGFSLVYSGDTDYTENLVRLAKGADILICESAMPDDLKIPGHLTPGLAGRIAREAGAGHLVLTHFYPECDPVDVRAQAAAAFSGPVTAARDLMPL